MKIKTNIKPYLHHAFNSLIVFILILSSSFNLLAQTSCCADGITFQTQEQINSFPINYPNCTHILGDVFIGSGNSSHNSDIVNLNGLNGVKAIDGSCTLKFLNALTTLKGLDSLSIVGDLSISNTYSLANLNGLNNLQIVEGNLSINHNRFLSNLEGLGALSFIGGNFNIETNDDLQNLNGLTSELTVVSGALIISRNANIKDLKGLEHLEEVGGLEININDSLTNLVGLHNIRNVYGDFSIGWNRSLINLEGLQSLTFVRRNFIITSNPKLVNLKGIGTGTGLFKEMDSFTISSNNKLESIEGIEQFNLSFVPKVVIRENRILSHCAVHSICERLASCASIEIAHNKGDCENISAVVEACLDDPKEKFAMACSISVHPNPARDFLHVSYGNYHKGLFHYELFDINGRSLLQARVDYGMIDISNLARGVYFIKFGFSDLNEVYRFLKL